MRFVIAGVIAALFAFSGQAASEPVTADVVVVGTFCLIQKTFKSKYLFKLLLKWNKLNKKKNKNKLRLKQIVVVVIRIVNATDLMDKEDIKENK